MKIEVVKEYLNYQIDWNKERREEVRKQSGINNFGYCAYDAKVEAFKEALEFLSRKGGAEQ